MAGADEDGLLNRDAAVGGRMGMFQILPSGGFAEAIEREAHRGGSRQTCVIVTDRNVRRLFGHLFPKDVPILEVGEGESSKTLASAEILCGGFLLHGLDRYGLVIAVGGGVVCDTAAFAASIWLRGVRCGLFPTTLLAQADAGLGGKCGVNFCGQKNLLGTIFLHEFCLCDPAFLASLPRQRIASGLAEAAKMACLYDEDLFRLLENNAPALLSGDTALLAAVVQRSLELKSAIVSADPFESGLRRQLNFGHTFGHALEAALALEHGAAVAVGMRLASIWSMEQGWLSHDDFVRLGRLLDLLELPGTDAAARLNPAEIRVLLGGDKKRCGNSIRFVVPTGIGLGKESVRTGLVPLEELASWMENKLRTEML